MKKILFVLLATFVFATAASAHVVVKPSQVGVGQFQTFTAGVPNEKDNPTVGLRLLIPDGLKSVSPNVKPGWTVTTKKSGSGDNATITEIDWTGGSIPAGQRDDFIFSAQVPSTQTTLKWKAYQTYQNGQVVEWIHDPSKNPEEDSAPPPYSQTKVVNDLSAGASDHATNQQAAGRKTDSYVAYIALALSAAALAMSLRKK